VGPRASSNEVEKKKFLTLLGLELRPLGSPGRSQSPYRLLYPGSLHVMQTAIKSGANKNYSGEDVRLSANEY
jgi:hypothetical protein